jgi:hypothetical protein
MNLDKISTISAEEDRNARLAFASPFPEESIARRIQHGPSVLGIPTRSVMARYELCEGAQAKSGREGVIGFGSYASQVTAP